MVFISQISCGQLIKGATDGFSQGKEGKHTKQGGGIRSWIENHWFTAAVYWAFLFAINLNC